MNQQNSGITLVSTDVLNKIIAALTNSNNKDIADELEKNKIELATKKEMPYNCWELDATKFNFSINFLDKTLRFHAK